MTTTEAYEFVLEYLEYHDKPSLRTLQRWAARNGIRKRGRDYWLTERDVKRFVTYWLKGNHA